MEGKDRFIKVYSNLPINLRNEVILVLKEGPITWNVAFLEINGNNGETTDLGKIILHKLIEFKLI